MKMEMYSIKDELSGYSTPIPIQNEEMAIRYFKSQLENAPIMQTEPKDFSIWKMGKFDNETGEYITEETGYKLIMRGE